MKAEQLVAIQPHLPELSFILQDLSDKDDQKLLARTRSEFAKLALYALMHFPDNPDPLSALHHMRELFVRVYRSDNGLEAVASVLEYVSKVTELDLETLRDYVEETVEPQDTEAVMGTAARQLIAKGKAEMLLIQLGKKFGPLPAETERRVRAAQPSELDEWSVRILDADSLDSALRGAS